MPAPSTLSKNFSEFGGLDYRSNDVTRKSRFAREVTNVSYLKNNTLSVRFGQKGRASSKGGGGTESYFRVSSAATLVEELITIDNNLWKLKEGSFTVTYTGADPNPALEIIPVLTGSTYSFRCRVYEGDTTVLDVDLGKGIDTASPYTVAQLITAIDGLANFACSGTGTTSGPAAFINNVMSSAIDTGLAVTFEYWEQIYCPTTNPFQAFWTKVNTDSFENACLFNHNNLLFIAWQEGKLYKYDGVSTYAAGMPAATTYNCAAGAAGLLAGTFYTTITYDFYDATGNNIEGDASNEKTTTVSAHKLNHTIPNLQPTSEYLTSCAIANNGGLQTGTTLTVDNGSGGAHTLQVGQTAFFHDFSGVAYEREITARTSTTITIAGAAVTIANDEVISANLRINLWRNKTGGSKKYLVKTFANNSFAATTSYVDEVLDSSLTIEYEPPVGGHGTPPEKLRYLTAKDATMLGSKGPIDSELVYKSDADGPEYFHTGFETIILRSKSNKPVKGLGANREIAVVLKADETHVITGNLATNDYRLERLADAIGTDSHHTIKDVDGSLYFYSGVYGIRRVVSNQLPADLSYRILPVISKKRSSSDQGLIHKRAVAVNYADTQQYIVYVPAESTDSGALHPNDSSVVFVADYRSQFEDDNDYDNQGRLVAQRPKIRWWRWNNLNMAGGITIYKDVPTWTERRYGTTIAAMEYPLCRGLINGNDYDYTDHAGTMSWYYESSWDTLGEPDLWKKFIRAVIYSFGELAVPYFTVTVKTELDFKNDQKHSEKSITFGYGTSSGGWGDGRWGEFAWGEDTETEKVFEFLLARTKAIKMVFEAEVFAAQPYISGWSIEAAPAYIPRIKKP